MSLATHLSHFYHVGCWGSAVAGMLCDPGLYITTGGSSELLGCYSICPELSVFGVLFWLVIACIFACLVLQKPHLMQRPHLALTCPITPLGRRTDAHRDDERAVLRKIAQHSCTVIPIQKALFSQPSFRKSMVNAQATYSWQRLSSDNHPDPALLQRAGHTATAVGTDIYVIGGKG